jgi:hypothetical protein
MDQFTIIESYFAKIKGLENINWEGYFKSFPDYRIFIEKIKHKKKYVYILGHSEGNLSAYGKEKLIKDGKVPESSDLHGKAIWRAYIQNNKLKEWRIFPYDEKTLNRLEIK